MIASSYCASSGNYHCPKCHWPLEPEEFNDLHCSNCSDTYNFISGTIVSLRALWQGSPLPDPYEEERERQHETRDPWTASSGCMGVSGVAVACSCSVRSVWNTVKALDIQPSYDKHHAVFDSEKASTIENYMGRPRLSEGVYTGGIEFKASRVVAGEVGLGRRWINKLVADGLVSGFISGQTMVCVPAMQDYLAAQQHRRGAVPTHPDRQQLSQVTHDQVTSAHLSSSPLSPQAVWQNSAEDYGGATDQVHKPSPTR